MLRIILQSILLVGTVIAWGPAVKVTKRLRCPQLGVSEKHSGAETDIQIESTDEDTSSVLWSSERERGGLDILNSFASKADILTEELFADIDMYDPCVGEECELECAIPEAWSRLPGSMDASEVLDFLKIRRAEPL